MRHSVASRILSIYVLAVLEMTNVIITLLIQYNKFQLKDHVKYKQNSILLITSFHSVMYI